MRIKQLANENSDYDKKQLKKIIIRKEKEPELPLVV